MLLRYLVLGATLAMVVMPARAADPIVGDCDGNGTVTISDLILGVQEAQTDCSLLGESRCPCDALVCFSQIPFLPPLFPIQCLEVAVSNALAQPCVGTATVNNGRVVCDPTTP